MFLPSQYNFHLFHITVVRDSLGYAWTIKSYILGLQRDYMFTTLQEWLSKQIPDHQIFPTHIHSPSLPGTFAFDTPASISFPLCSLAKAYFIISLYFITSLNIVVSISIIPSTSAHILCIGYLTSTFTYISSHISGNLAETSCWHGKSSHNPSH